MKYSELHREEFLQILEEYKKLIFKIASAYCRDAEERKDLVQEIIIQLWRALPDYNNNYARSTWIYRIALNVSISNYRKEKTREKTHNEFVQQFDLVEGMDEVADQRLRHLYRLIEMLKPLDKALIILFLEGRKNKEIASIMGISASNVSSKIHRIKDQLSSNIKSNEYE